MPGTGKDGGELGGAGGDGPELTGTGHRPGPRSAARGLLATAVLAPVLLVAGLLGTSLVGLTVFAGTDILESQPPWSSDPVVTGGPYNQCTGDVVDARLPAAIETRERLLAGDLPWWSSLPVAGGPLAAAPTEGVTSPLALPLLLLPAPVFPAALKLAETAVVLLGALLLGRRLGLGAGSSLVLGTAFVGSGFMVTWTGWPQTQTAALFPLALWSVERVLQDRTWRSLVPLPLVLGGMILGGFPVLVVYFAYLAAAWGAVRLVQVGREHGFGAVGRVVVLAVAGAAATVLLTAWSLLPLARRLAAVDTSTRVYTYPLDLQPTQLATVFFPEALGTCRAGSAFWGAVNPVESTAFAGLAVVLLAVVAVLAPRPAGLPRGAVVTLTVVAALGLAVSFVQGPVAEAVALLPGVGDSPITRLRSIGGLAFAVLAAVGVEVLLRGRSRPAPGRGAAVVAGLLAALAVAAGSLWLARRATPNADLLADVEHTAWVGAAGGAAVLAAVALWLTGARRLRAVAVALVPLAVALEVAVFAHAFWPRSAPETFYRQTPVHELLASELGSDRSAAVDDALFHGAETAYGIRSLTGHEFAPTAFVALLERAEPRLRRASPTVLTLTPDAVGSPVLDRFGVRYVVAPYASPPAGTVAGPDRLGPGSVTLAAGDRVVGSVTGDTLDAATLELAGSLADRVELRVATARAGQPTGCETRVVLPAGARERVTLPLAGGGCAATAGELVVEVVSGSLAVRADAAGQAWLGAVELPPGVALVDVEGAVVYENLDNLGRVRWAGDAVVVDGPDAARDLLAAGELAATETVLVQPDGEPGQGGEPGGAGLPALSGAGAELAVLADDGDRVVVDVDADGAGLLVLADGVLGEWEALVDGRRVELLPVETAFVGVPVPAGSHEVVLRYDSRDERALLALAAATAAGLVLAGTLAAWRARRSGGLTARG